jgi:hypothetical protein
LCLILAVIFSKFLKPNAEEKKKKPNAEREKKERGGGFTGGKSCEKKKNEK